MNTQHAVLTQQGLLYIHKDKWVCKGVPNPLTLCPMAELCLAHHISHLWIMNGWEYQPETDTGWSFAPHERSHHVAAISCWKRGHRQKDVEIIFPEYTSWHGTEKAPGWMYGVDPHDLLITLRYLEQCLEVPIGMSPGRVGWNYLKKLHPEWVEEIPGVDLKECHFISAVAPDIIWQRSLLTHEGNLLYLHKFDENASYPYAATQTDIGVGTPAHVDHGRDMDDFQTDRGTTRQSQAVGVWRVTAYVDPLPEFRNMPQIWHKREGWLAGPIIRLLRKAGVRVTVHEGYVFPEHHDVMVKWAKDLWIMRQVFNGAPGTEGMWKSEIGAKLAAKATKQLMNSTIGLTAFRKFDDDDEMKRPDIRAQIIARHTELTWHRINKIRQTYGVTPVLVYMDALYYLSNEPDGRKAFPELVKREGEMGGYKWEGRVSMDAGARAILSSKMGEAEKLEHLNKIGWMK